MLSPTTPTLSLFISISFTIFLVVELDTFKLDTLTKEQLNIIEADSFWCLSKFLDCIQDNYIFAQLGIQAKVNQLKELIQRIDGIVFLDVLAFLLLQRIPTLMNFMRQIE